MRRRPYSESDSPIGRRVGLVVYALRWSTCRSWNRSGSRISIGSADELGGLVPEHLAGVVVDRRDHAVVVDDDDAVGRGGEEVDAVAPKRWACAPR